MRNFPLGRCNVMQLVQLRESLSELSCSLAAETVSRAVADNLEGIER